MKKFSRTPFALAMALVTFPAWAQTLPREETLSYSVNWPSGLSLGEAQLSAKKHGEGFEFKMTIDAGVPGVPVRDEYTSVVNEAGCSLEFRKESTHGMRKTSERSVFDLAAGTVVRQSLPSGGKSELRFTSCPHDALAFLYYLRKEILQGRRPGTETVYFGGAYQVRLSYAGVDRAGAGEARTETDRFTGAVKGLASENSFEIQFGRDAARTPLVVKVPFSLGTFSMELNP